MIINRNFNHSFKLLLFSLHQHHVDFFMVRFKKLSKIQYIWG